jgi:hypothetical protein
MQRCTGRGMSERKKENKSYIHNGIDKSKSKISTEMLALKKNAM